MISSKPLDRRSWRYSSAIRVTSAVIVGVVTALLALTTPYYRLGILWGWDAAALVYISWVLIAIVRLDCHRTEQLASDEDPDRITADLLMVLASVVSLAAVAMAMVQSNADHGSYKTASIVTCFASVVLSWTLVHVTFTLRYARLYYANPKGGIEFHEEFDPAYLDFAYLAFTVGMTFQVSDTDIKKSSIRHAILRQALLSYLFGTVILATTINLVAGLIK